MKIADTFNEYFTSINATTVLPDGENLATSQSELDILLQDFVNSHIPPSSQDKFCIPLITKETVEADRSKIPSNKATGLDGISVRVLKEALPAIYSSLALIYNASISNGVFPVAFKIVKVLPLHKRDSIQERGNYRPISVLPILSKPLERHIASAYLQYLTSDNLQYHTGTNTMDWFRSYLTGRTQVVSVSGVLSSPLHLDDGVPQGSINDLPLLLKDTEVDIYADDTTIWSSGTNSTDIENILNDSLDKANSWFKVNRMIPNTKKTKHLLVGSV